MPVPAPEIERCQRYDYDSSFEVNMAKVTICKTESLTLILQYGACNEHGLKINNCNLKQTEMKYWELELLESYLKDSITINWLRSKLVTPRIPARTIY
jgi:hypothetical protein